MHQIVKTLNPTGTVGTAAFTQSDTLSLPFLKVF